jgi:hypothetical protein
MRDRNPRVLVFEALKPMLDNVTFMRLRWNGPAKEVKTISVDGKVIRHQFVRAEIQTEDVPENWLQLARYMRVVEKQAGALARYAENHAQLMN